MKLQQRIEYLSRAVMCAKSSSRRTSASSEGEFLQELEEKLEVSGEGRRGVADVAESSCAAGEPVGCLRWGQHIVITRHGLLR